MDKWLERCQRGELVGALHQPAPAGCLQQCEQRLGLQIPDSYRRMLSQFDGGVLFHEAETENSGLHLFGCCTGLVEQTEHFRMICPDILDLAVMGYTPGAGAFYLAIEPQGAIIDLFGSPYFEATEPSAFPYYRGDWRVIAPDIASLLDRMWEKPSEPFYWFTIR